jgi:hypothetical protein
VKKETPVSAKGRHVYLAVSCLEMDPAVQRKLRMAWVKEHVADFDPELFGEVVVSLRGGRHLIVDGQHRVEILRQLGWADQKIPCLLYEGLTLAEEAKLFRGLGDRKGLRAFDDFRIAIVEGDPVACDIDRIVRAQGLTLSDQKKDGAVSAVDALRRVYCGATLKQSSPVALGKALRLLKSAWGSSGSAFEGPMIIGAGLFFLRYNGSADESALVAKLAKVPGGPAGMIGRAKALTETKRRRVGECVAAGIVDAYNSGRRSGKLEDWWA